MSATFAEAAYGEHPSGEARRNPPRPVTASRKVERSNGVVDRSKAQVSVSETGWPATHLWPTRQIASAQPALAPVG